MKKVDHGFDIKAIRRELASEDWEDWDENEWGSCTEVRRVYLGTVFTLSPSGKFYMPFAHSNLGPCPVCNGKGTIGAHKSRRVRNRNRARYERIMRLAIKRHGRGSDGVRRTCNARQRAYSVANGFSCPRCDGCGSHEAADDARWREAVEQAFDCEGWCLESGEGDPCDLFVAEYRDADDNED